MSNDTQPPVVPGYPSPAETAAHWASYQPSGEQRPWLPAGQPPWQTETGKRGIGRIFALAALATFVVAIFSAALIIRSQNLLPASVPVIGMDTGVAACKAISEGGSPASPGEVTEAQYVKLRQVFAGSRYPAIRDNGVKVVDLGHQIQAIPKGEEIQALVYIGPFTSAYAGLSGGCAERGYTIPALSAS